MTDNHMQLPMCGQRINKQMRWFRMRKNTQIALIPLNAKRPFRRLQRYGAFIQAGIRLKRWIYLAIVQRRWQDDGEQLNWEEKRWNDGPTAQYFHRQLESTALRAVINIEALHHNRSAGASEGSTAGIHHNAGIHQALNPITQILATFKLATW